MNTPAPSDTAPQWAWHLQALVRLKKLVEEGMRETQEALRRDPGVEAIREQLRTILAEEEAELAEIAEAIERIRTGSYGICETTGREMPAEHLRAMPWARCCPAQPGDATRARSAVSSAKSA